LRVPSKTEISILKNHKIKTRMRKKKLIKLKTIVFTKNLDKFTIKETKNIKKIKGLNYYKVSKIKK
jgi:hypothetical protein